MQNLSLLYLLGAAQMFIQSSSSAVVAPQGTIIVTLKDQSGVSIPSLGVHYTRIPELSSPKSGLVAPGDYRLSGALSTGTAGSVQTSLPVGHYLVCAETGTTSYLDPCRWAAAIAVDVVSGQTTPVSITLSKGVHLQIAISDPKHLLPPDRRPAGPPPVIVGVIFGQGAFLAANCTSVSGAISCSMSIPAAVPFKLWLLNPTIGFAQVGGGTVASNGVGPAFQAATGIDQQFSFIASGSKLSGTVAP